MGKLSDVELVVARSRELEKLLEQRFGATGRGLGSRARNCANRIEKPILRSIMRLAAQRNAVVHDGRPLKSRKAFSTLADEVRTALKAKKPRPKRKAGPATPPPSKSRRKRPAPTRSDRAARAPRSERAAAAPRSRRRRVQGRRRWTRVWRLAWAGAGAVGAWLAWSLLGG